MIRTIVFMMKYDSNRHKFDLNPHTTKSLRTKMIPIILFFVSNDVNHNDLNIFVLYKK